MLPLAHKGYPQKQGGHTLHQKSQESQAFLQFQQPEKSNK